MEKFKIETQSIAYRWSEEINETHKCLYMFNVDNGNPPRQISFEYIALTENVQRLKGLYSFDTNSVSIQSNSILEPIGNVVDEIMNSCNEIYNSFIE